MTLCKIIEALNPEIIFEEMAPYAFDEYYKNKTRNSIEADAIQLYLAKHQMEHIPIDYNVKMPQSFWDDYKYYFNRLKANSSEFRKLIDWDAQYVERYGFQYLNSIYCDNLWTDYDIETKKILERLNDERLFQAYKAWNDVTETRENTMLNNIYSYCRTHEFKRGLFLIGAGHRKSIMNKIEVYEKENSIKVNWEFDAVKKMCSPCNPPVCPP